MADVYWNTHAGQDSLSIHTFITPDHLAVPTESTALILTDVTWWMPANGERWRKYNSFLIAKLSHFSSLITNNNCPHSPLNIMESPNRGEKLAPTHFISKSNLLQFNPILVKPIVTHLNISLSEELNFHDYSTQIFT